MAVPLGSLTDDSVLAVSAVKTSADAFNLLTQEFISTVTEAIRDFCELNWTN